MYSKSKTFLFTASAAVMICSMMLSSCNGAFNNQEQLNSDQSSSPDNGGGGGGGLPPLKNFSVTDFVGRFASDVNTSVINAKITWNAFTGAAYYEVFIDGEKTNDPADGKLTEKKFQTAEGIVDIDKKMTNTEKEITVSVKAYDAKNTAIAQSSVKKLLPKKNMLGIPVCNGTDHSDGIEVENPLTITLPINNGVKFIDEDEAKALQNCQQYLIIEQYGEAVPSHIQYNKAAQSLHITPLGGLKEKAKYTFKIKQGFCDKANMYYTDTDKSYIFTVKANPSSPELSVKKVLINDDPNLDLTAGKKTGIPVDGTVSVYFNQLILLSSFEKADPSKKGSGIYITTSTTGKGFDDSRLEPVVFENVMQDDILVTKITFRMAGKTSYTGVPDPLAGNTDYFIVVEDTLRSVANKKLSADLRLPFSTGAEKLIPHTLEIKDGIIEGNTGTEPNKQRLTKGTQVTIKAVVPDGKQFDYWYVNDDDAAKVGLTEATKKKNPFTFTMPDEDIHFTAYFK